jgi:glycosyltransferase involved in cell wall biosynthesis
MTNSPSVTVVIPSFNQGEFLEAALQSVFSQAVPIEAIVLDGGSKDSTVEVIKKYEARLLFWRSCKDRGQAAAINEGVARGTAPYVCWLNSDDLLLPGGLSKLINTLEKYQSAPAVYGKCLIVDKYGGKKKVYWTSEFSEKHLANRCFIAQPATLIRRKAWEQVSGLNEKLQMSMDYDLWWRLYRHFGNLFYTHELVAASRWHRATKTNVFRRAHYRESMMVVRKYYGSVPIKWHIAWPIRVFLWDFFNKSCMLCGKNN